jgi:hypothetical protein
MQIVSRAGASDRRMTMPPCMPNPATRPRIGGITVAALLAGLGLAAALATNARDRAIAPEPAVTPPIASEVVVPVHLVSALQVPASSLDAADLVGIYRARDCTLTLDASGTYTLRGCGDHRRHSYAIEGNQVVLQDMRLVVVGPGRLVSAAGTTFTITGGVR